MKYTHFDPDAVAEPPAPTRGAILMQIESDHHNATTSGDRDSVTRLNAWHKAVTATETDEDAREVYRELVAEMQASQPQPAPESEDQDG